MKTSINKDQSKVIIEIELENSEWQETLKQAAIKISKSVEIKGFRSGQAPLDIVISQVGEAKVINEAADTAVAKFYSLAIQQHNLIPVIQPKISINKVNVSQPLSFKIEVIVMPEVVLGDYKKIRVKSEPIKMDKSQIDKALGDIQRRQAVFKEVERASKEGDWVEIDFLGKLKGEPFDGGKSQHHPLIIGDGVFLPDFEKALIGLIPEENKTFSVNFPENYHQKNLAGQKVEFEVKLHQVKEVIMPPIDDELAKQIGKFETLEDLRLDIEKWLQKDAQKKEKSRQQEEAMNQLIKLAKVDIPDELINQELMSMIQDLSHQLSQQQMTLEDYFKKQNTTEEKIKEQWRDMAKQRVLAGLALDAFKKREGIKATNQEVDQDIERMKIMHPDQKDKLDEKYKSDLEKKRLGHMLAGQKALKHLWELAVK